MPKLWEWDGTASVSSPWIPQQEVNEFMGMIVRWKQLVVHNTYMTETISKHKQTMTPRLLK